MKHEAVRLRIRLNQLSRASRLVMLITFAASILLVWYFQQHFTERDDLIDNYYRQEAFIDAIVDGDVDKVKKLIKAGVNVNATAGFASHETSYPLTTAATQGNAEIARLLLTHGADPNIRKSTNWTPLMEAAWRGHIDVVQVLLTSGADVNISSREYGTALNIALAKQHTEIVTQLKESSQNSQ